MTLLNVEDLSVEEVSTTIFGQGGAIYHVINGTGLSYEGVPYYYYSGAVFNNNTDRIAVLCRYENGEWINVKESAFWPADENPNQYLVKIRPACIELSMNPVSGVTVHGETYGSGSGSGGGRPAGHRPRWGRSTWHRA